MLTFKLIGLENGYYHYEIYPEDKIEDKGILIFNPETKHVKKKIEPKSPFDCIGHFLQNVRDDNGNFKTQGLAAWY